MSKLSFRARALDATKPMPVFLAEELTDLSECTSINRAVPQMPTGMEKEEEMELHLQQVLSAQQAITSAACSSLTEFDPENVVIPIPKVISADSRCYESVYRPDYKPPKQLIKIQAALNLEPESADYDLDSDDEVWMESQQKNGFELDPLHFEKMMDRLEKHSEHHVVKPEQAKGLLNDEDDDVILAVYDYWLNKRLTLQVPLIPQIKTEKRDGTSGNNPYYAFRRRAEKMQTRKHRKNDEESYEKMLRIRSDLRKAVTLLEMIKRREKSKRELLNLSVEVFERRYLLEDWNNELYDHLRQAVKPAFQFSKEELRSLKRGREQQQQPLSSNTSNEDGSLLLLSPPRKRNRHRHVQNELQCTKNEIVSRDWLLQNEEEWHRPTTFPGSSLRLQEEAAAKLNVDQKSAEAESVDGSYAFKRRRGCLYQAPITDHPYDKASIEAVQSVPPQFDRVCGSPVRSHFRYTHAYLHSRRSACGLSYVGLVRRRTGRGGRILFDRVSLPKDLHGMDPMGVFMSKTVEDTEPQPSTSSACSSVTLSQDAKPSVRLDVTGNQTSQQRFDRRLNSTASVSDATASVTSFKYPAFRPSSPVTLDVEMLIDDALDFNNRFTRCNDPMWMAATDSSESDQLYEASKRSQDTMPLGSLSTTVACATVIGSSSGSSVIPVQVGVTATAYGIHHDQLLNSIHRQGAALSASDDPCSSSRNKLLAGTKPAVHLLVPAPDVIRQLDSTSAHYACSAVNTTEDYKELLFELCGAKIRPSTSGLVVSAPTMLLQQKNQANNTVQTNNSSGSCINNVVRTANGGGNGGGSAPASAAAFTDELSSRNTTVVPTSTVTSAATEPPRTITSSRQITITSASSAPVMQMLSAVRQNSHTYSLPPTTLLPAPGTSLVSRGNQNSGQAQYSFVLSSISASDAASSKHCSPSGSTTNSRSNSPIEIISTRSPKMGTGLRLAVKKAVLNGPIGGMNSTTTTVGVLSRVASASQEGDVLVLSDCPTRFITSAALTAGVPTTSPRLPRPTKSTLVSSRVGGNGVVNLISQSQNNVVDPGNVILDTVEYYPADGPLLQNVTQTNGLDIYPLLTPSPSPNSRVPPSNGSISDAGTLLLKQQTNNNGTVRHVLPHYNSAVVASSTDSTKVLSNNDVVRNGTLSTNSGVT